VGERVVQLLDMVDNLTSLREPVFDWFFVILLKRQVASSSWLAHHCLVCSIKELSQGHFVAIAGFIGSQAGTGGSGQQSTSPAVHLRLVLPAAMAGVRCRYRDFSCRPSPSRV
jgi:hypothetical protein